MLAREYHRAVSAGRRTNAGRHVTVSRMANLEAGATLLIAEAQAARSTSPTGSRRAE
jgi:hypothetical protein